MYVYEGVTQVISGLACVYERNRASICSVCTREKMRLPNSFCSEIDAISSRCYFGYNPVNRVYKLLKLSIFKFDGFSYSHICQILTIGLDSSWRLLDAAIVEPMIKFDRKIFSSESLLVGGILYWIVDCWDDCRRLISFDLNEEKFQLIEPPEDALFWKKGYKWELIQFMGRIGLLVCTEFETLRCFVIHTLLDNEGKSWDRHDIPLPSEGMARGTAYVGNLPTGQILFSDLPNKKPNCFTTVYSYDHQTNKLDRLLVGGLPDIRYPTQCRVTFLEENLAPLDALLSGGRQLQS